MLTCVFPCFILAVIFMCLMENGGTGTHTHRERNLTSFPNHCFDTVAIISVGTCSLGKCFIFYQENEKQFAFYSLTSRRELFVPNSISHNSHISIPVSFFLSHVQARVQATPAPSHPYSVSCFLTFLKLWAFLKT